jgi:curli biogenesis system outer membrane secretion channel CsgG
MIRATGSLWVLAAAAALAGCAGSPSSSTSAIAADNAASPAKAAAAPVGAEVVRTLYASPHREDGVVLDGAHAGAHFTKWAKPDGSLELSAAHGLFADTGKFIVKGNEVCSSWEHIDNGRQGCVQLMKVGTNEYVTLRPDGSEGTRFRVSPP